MEKIFECEALTKKRLALMKNKFRAVDEKECNALSGLDAYTCARLGASVSKQGYIISFMEKPFCVFGVANSIDNPKLGVPWALFTNDIDHNKEFRKFVLYVSKDFLTLLSSGYEGLFNYVHEDNRKAIKWLTWLGFEMGEPRPVGKSSEKFIKFYKGV
jgi:hypothetical protein